jgi:hypothetical protein
MLLSIVLTLLPGVLTSIIALFAGLFIQRTANKYSKQKETRAMIEDIYRKVLEVSGLKNALDHPDELDTIDLGPQEIYESQQRLQNSIDGTIQEMEILIELYLGPLKKNFVAYKKSIQSSQNVEDATQKFCSAISKFFKEKGYSYF